MAQTTNVYASFNAGNGVTPAEVRSWVHGGMKLYPSLKGLFTNTKQGIEFGVAEVTWRNCTMRQELEALIEEFKEEFYGVCVVDYPSPFRG